MCKYLIRFPMGSNENDKVILNITSINNVAPHIYLGNIYGDNVTIL